MSLGNLVIALLSILYVLIPFSHKN